MACLDGAGELLADDRSHASHDEAAVGEPEDDSNALDEPLSDDCGLFEAGAGLLALDALGIGPAVIEAQGIERLEARDPLLERIGIEKLGDPLASREQEMVVALRANAEVLLDLLAEQRRLAAVAAHPDAFGHPLSFGVLVPGVWSSSFPPWHETGPPDQSWQAIAGSRGEMQRVIRPFRCAESIGAISMSSKPPQDHRSSS